MYEDDGVSPAYKQGGFRRTTVSVKRVAGGYVVTISAPQGSYNPGPRKFSFLIKSMARSRHCTVDNGRRDDDRKRPRSQLRDDSCDANYATLRQCLGSCKSFAKLSKSTEESFNDLDQNCFT